ncbi:MAG: CDP-glucose 4,6-dehydratase [Sphingomicrobium sp.]
MRSSSWNDRRVLVTGHTGFKGGWLSLWLNQLGAKVSGFSLPAPTEASFFEQTRLRELVKHVEGDVRDPDAVRAAISDARPEVVFHLAAQPLVRYSYDNPVETFATNVMGTVNVLEACRHVDSVRAVVCITTDKCYENREWVWPYRESDPMGGHDPYSASKGAAEIAIASYRRSYPQGPAIASVRAGNVIGGGDWATDRLIPDIVRALLDGKRPLIRNPDSIRPWQHVMEALAGYLLIAQRLLEGRSEVATAYNFGPSDEDAQPVSWIVEEMLRTWGAEGWDRPNAPQPHEAVLLKLDTSKARAELGWRPALRLQEALARVVEWHSEVSRGGDARAISLRQLKDYTERSEARMGQVQWA